MDPRSSKIKAYNPKGEMKLKIFLRLKEKLMLS